MRLRKDLVNQDTESRFDKDIVLNSKELAVDSLLSSYRDKEILTHGGRYIFASNFRTIQDDIKRTQIYALLNKMPKGSILHTHAIGDARFLFMKGTYDPECYVNLGSGSLNHPKYSFMYSSTQPPSSPRHAWYNVVELRNATFDKKLFDEELYSKTQFLTPLDEVSENEMWVYFDTTIRILASLGRKEEVWRAHIIDSLEKLVKDGVIHFEVRGYMNWITDGTTRKYNTSQILQIWLDIVADFNSKLPQSAQISVRFISVTDRMFNDTIIWDTLMETIQLQQSQNGDYVVGFDIVDQEDRYHTLIYYLQDWLNIAEYTRENNLPPLKYYFHTGETEWDKHSSANLYDALLLNTTRIGHGFALRDYPYLLKETIAKGIAIEVSPISNQMLRLVDDMRDHPAATFLNRGGLVTISNDDPSIYGYYGLTYDYWAAYMSWNLSVSGLKQLTINGIKYSALPSSEKERKLKQLDGMWNEWINNIYQAYVA